MLDFDISESSIWRVIYNETFVDPKYTPPNHRNARSNSIEWNVKCAKCGKRLPKEDFYARKACLRVRDHKTCIGCWKIEHEREQAAYPERSREIILTARKPTRLASIGCKYTCPKCGSAYPIGGREPFRSWEEANKCCEVAK
jgi:hypothetical protein